MRIETWTIDYGQGPRPVRVPHVWHTDVPVAWEGLALYATSVRVPKEKPILRFHGVSYEAVIAVNGVEAARHEGIWDAFDVDLSAWTGQEVRIEVSVRKNGGPTFPVREVLSGFLPYVFHTFGGIFREVEFTNEPLEPERGSPEPSLPMRAASSSSEGREGAGRLPFLRGLLTWGWYPEIGSPHPDEDTIRDEIRKAKALGFNLVKFCLWVPSHRYLEILEQEGMLGWLELPLWDPADSAEVRERLARELKRIVRQYRHHRCLAVWTIGCELSHATPPEWRKELVEFVRAETGAWVKDNSGGAEMYGGSLLEFGDFHDYHPYCDLPFYGPVLESLANGPRRPLPVLLGEFNDIDVHRDLPRLRREMPYWASPDPVRNPQGVRWQHDLPYFLPKTPFAVDEERSRALQESSRRKAIFIRKHVHECVRQQHDIAGYVVTGWRDTPISTAGMFDDYGKPRFTPEECAAWNSDVCVFRIPIRRPPWVNGGNRPGWQSLSCYFSDQEVFVRLGIAGEAGDGEVRLLDAAGQVVLNQALPPSQGLEPRFLADLCFGRLPAGDYALEVEVPGYRNRWDLASVERFPGGAPSLSHVQTVACPFWREAAYEFHGPLEPLADQWHVWLDVSPDAALDPDWLQRQHPDAQILLNRVDTRTYRELPVVALAGRELLTTLRWEGGLGRQPHGWARNPAAHRILRALEPFMDLRQTEA
jgi:hypothetical protein